MKNKKMSREEIITEWLNLYPIQHFKSEYDEKNNVVILVPHKENWLIQKLLPKPKLSAQKVHLDEIGTFIWNHCDGNYTIKTISDKLAEKFGERIAPKYERTVLFSQQLYQQDFIKVYEKKHNKNQ